MYQEIAQRILPHHVLGLHFFQPKKNQKANTGGATFADGIGSSVGSVGAIFLSDGFGKGGKGGESEQKMRLKGNMRFNHQPDLFNWF